jgi:hypothetical protein
VAAVQGSNAIFQAVARSRAEAGTGARLDLVFLRVGPVGARLDLRFTPLGLLDRFVDALEKSGAFRGAPRRGSVRDVGGLYAVTIEVGEPTAVVAPDPATTVTTLPVRGVVDAIASAGGSVRTVGEEHVVRFLGRVWMDVEADFRDVDSIAAAIQAVESLRGLHVQHVEWQRHSDRQTLSVGFQVVAFLPK